MFLLSRGPHKHWIYRNQNFITQKFPSTKEQIAPRAMHETEANVETSNSQN